MGTLTSLSVSRGAILSDVYVAALVSWHGGFLPTVVPDSRLKRARRRDATVAVHAV